MTMTIFCVGTLSPFCFHTAHCAFCQSLAQNQALISVYYCFSEFKCRCCYNLLCIKSKMPKPPPTPQYPYYEVLNGGLTNTTISPLTKSIPTFLVFLLTISSPVSSSSSMVVMVSSTWDRTMLRCWSYAWRMPRSSRELRHLMYTRSERDSFIRSNGSSIVICLVYRFEILPCVDWGVMICDITQTKPCLSERWLSTYVEWCVLSPTERY